jgi:hypothetical protein
MGELILNEKYLTVTFRFKRRARNEMEDSLGLQREEPRWIQPKDWMDKS